MNKIKWFTGGNKRSEEAIKFLTILQANLKNTTDLPLTKILGKYSIELKNQQGSTPIILSRLNLDISRCLLNNKIHLSEENQKLIKDISSLSQIRYGY